MKTVINTMLGILVALAFILWAILPAGAAPPAPLPVASVNDLGPSAQPTGGGKCENGIEVFALQFEKGGKPYGLYLGDNRAFILVEGGPSMETPIWFGTYHQESGAFTVLESLAAKDLKDPSVCKNLARFSQKQT